MHRILQFSMIAALAISSTAFAGPPFFTDDPEPVKPDHWEFYLATQNSAFHREHTGTSPHVEINYGAYKDVQLHLITSFSYDELDHERHSGYGDTEVGVKWRFLHETDWLPQIGTFPLIEAPTGNRKLGLGNGKPQYLLPLWLQKSFGHDKWTIYGGGGYWINNGKDNKNFEIEGVVLQRKVFERLSLGGEVFYSTPSEKRAAARTALNAGGTFDFTEHHHLLFSAGRDVNGGGRKFSSYLAFQITF
jgi:hypothetical protein